MLLDGAGHKMAILAVIGLNSMAVIRRRPLAQARSFRLSAN
jgi:hypothetical protein